MKQELRDYLEIEVTDFDEFKEVCEKIRDSLILTKEEFIKEAQGSFENDDKNLWVEVEGIDCNVPYAKEESRPFENSDRFDEMPLEEALNDETFDELYNIYLLVKISSNL